MKLAPKSIPLAAVLLAFASQATAVAGVTVGEFVRSTAELVGARPATLEGLRAAGFAVPVMNPEASLTEADVISIGAAVGVAMQTATPRAAVSERRALRILAYLDNRTRQNAQGTQSSNGDSESSDPRRRPRSRSPRVPHNPHFPHGPR